MLAMAGLPLRHVVTHVRGWLDLGVRHFCIGHDLRILFDWCKTQGAGIREMLK